MLLSGDLRAEGARFWLPKDDQDERQVTAIPSAERDHFLEVSHPDRGNKLPDLEAARAIRKQLASGRGRRRAKEKKTQPLVCLDISHLPENHLRALVGSELDLCKQLGSANPYREPLWVQPGWVGRAGGLWVDHEENAAGHLAEPSPRNHSTNIAGLYASSTAGQLYHGSNRLSGNQLLAALFAGRTAARSAAAYCEAADEPKHGKELDAAQRDAQRSYKSLCDRDDDDEDNAVDVQRRLRRALRKTNFETDEQQLVARQEELLQLRERAGRSGCGDDSDSANSGAPRLRQLDRMLLLAELGLAGAQQRLSLKAHEPDLDDHGEERAKRPRSLLCRYRAGSIEQVDRCSYELLGQSISVSAQEHEHEEPER